MTVSEMPKRVHDALEKCRLLEVYTEAVEDLGVDIVIAVDLDDLSKVCAITRAEFLRGLAATTEVDDEGRALIERMLARSAAEETPGVTLGFWIVAGSASGEIYVAAIGVREAKKVARA